MSDVEIAESLLLTGSRELVWHGVPPPPLGPHDLLVRTDAGAISIGSEVPIYAGTSRSAAPASYPVMTGYESVGTALAVGAEVTNIQPGQRVVAFYGHRTRWVVPEVKALPVPDDVSDALALLAILTCDVAKGIRALAPTPELSALITGAGAMGLLTLAMLRAYGVTWVDMAEPHERRQALARHLGARRAGPPAEFSGSDATYALGFECSSRDAGFALLQRRMRHGGRIRILADGNIEPLTLTPDFHTRELRVAASSDGWDYHAHAAWYFDWQRRHPEQAANLASLFEERITRDELPATFARLATGGDRPVKVLVRYR